MLDHADLRVITPLDPKEGRIYVEKVREGMIVEGLDRIYKVIAQTEDYINPTDDGNLSWRGITSCTSDYDEVLENW